MMKGLNSATRVRECSCIILTILTKRIMIKWLVIAPLHLLAGIMIYIPTSTLVLGDVNCHLITITITIDLLRQVAKQKRVSKSLCICQMTSKTTKGWQIN